ncbi:MAG TPA: biopolymer transporter ExbD [Fibrobacteria bacterium]|nr:biopolymer transporter ExbD [Fibrobacteria bacterium]
MAKRRVKKQKDAHLIITSLIDVFVIVLVFLLRSVSSEGNLMTSADNLVLPMSARSKSPTEVSLTVIGDPDNINVDDHAVAKTADVRKQDSLLVPGILKLLEKKRAEEKKAEMLGVIKEATGKVVVQLDKNTPYDIVTKLMATCGYAGYNNIKFAVSKKGEE